jgi:hypothetical protein
MRIAVDVPVRLVRAALAVVIAVAGVLAGVAVTTATAQSASKSLPRIVILARSDNPADALAAGPVGGVLGAPVLLTPSDRLHVRAAEALDSFAPDLVVLAGGEAALSQTVERAVADLGFESQRVAGRDRHETAALISALLMEMGAGRPVVTGAPVTDQVIPGLNAELLQGLDPEDVFLTTLASRYEIVTKDELFAPGTTSSFGTVLVDCPEGKRVFGGGGTALVDIVGGGPQPGSTSQVTFIQSYPSDEDTWVETYSFSGNTTSTKGVRGYAICA